MGKRGSPTDSDQSAKLFKANHPWAAMLHEVGNVAGLGLMLSTLCLLVALNYIISFHVLAISCQSFEASRQTDVVQGIHPVQHLVDWLTPDKYEPLHTWLLEVDPDTKHPKDYPAPVS